MTAFAQQPVPYSTDFDYTDSPEGWSHYAISGFDDWAFGHPSSSLSPISKGWETGFGSNYPAADSNRALETPAFNLSGTGAKVISFTHRTQGTTQYEFYVESSIDNGATWALVNSNVTYKKLNWQITGGFFPRAIRIC